MKQIVLASSNPGKVREINQLLADLDLQVRPQSEFGVEDAEETGLSFVENAILKARNAARHTGLPAIADDSGIEVDALNGAPGIYSARFAGTGASDRDNLEKLLADLRGVPEAGRSARFQCLHRIRILLEPRENDDVHAALPLGNAAGSLQATDARHADVHQHDVRRQLPAQGDCLLTGARLPNHLDFP